MQWCGLEPTLILIEARVYETWKITKNPSVARMYRIFSWSYASCKTARCVFLLLTVLVRSILLHLLLTNLWFGAISWHFWAVKPWLGIADRLSLPTQKHWNGGVLIERSHYYTILTKGARTIQEGVLTEVGNTVY